MNKFSYVLTAGLFALPLAIGVSVPKEVEAARHGCPHLDKYLNRVKGSSIPYKVYFLKVSGLEDPTIPKRARAKFARNLMAEWNKKDGFFADFTQDGCDSITFTFPETKKYRIRSSTASTLVLEGENHLIGERGTVQMSSSTLDRGSVLLNVTFDFKFIDGCEDGGSVIKPITIRALVAWGRLDLNGGSERAASATATQLAGYAREWEESAGCEKHDGERHNGEKDDHHSNENEGRHHQDDEHKSHVD